MTKTLSSGTIVAVFVILTIMAGVHSETMAGGLGAAKPADEDVTSLVAELKSAIIEKICALPENQNKAGACPSSNAEVKVQQYKSQVVSGVNYFCSLLVGGVPYHVRLYHQSWTKTKEVTSVKKVAQNAEITYF